jgi:hypothetical protein
VIIILKFKTLILIINYQNAAEVGIVTVFKKGNGNIIEVGIGGQPGIIRGSDNKDRTFRASQGSKKSI